MVHADDSLSAALERGRGAQGHSGTRPPIKLQLDVSAGQQRAREASLAAALEAAALAAREVETRLAESEGLDDLVAAAREGQERAEG